LALVDRLCAAGPTIVIAEDLHWADEPSLLLWSRLARAVDQIHCCFWVLPSGTRRAKVLRLEELVVENGGTVLQLRPLADAEAGEVAGRIIGVRPARRCAPNWRGPAATRSTSGNSSRHWSGTTLVETVGGVSEMRAGAGATTGLAHHGDRPRLRFLPEATIQDARLAALLATSSPRKEPQPGGRSPW